ncbi:MAG: hypothetical protein HOE76_00545 [Euryarchaeota archaeon]|nr:hypothetical protein [Euryarchaeota archaeon]MBT4982370.1 hypothetical protein [Euryarchaeota archaeon]MBT5184055.1 hypothetical protein [Euryarchaeota archaeon]
MADSPTPESLGSESGGKHLNTPLVGWAAFSATYKVMFIEEFRENLDFAKKRRIMLFPLLVALVTMVATIGLQFLVGEGAAQGSDSLSDSSSFSWQEMRFALHLPLLMFSLGMGSFAFLGREKVLARTGTKNYLLASPALQPLTNSTAHFAYFMKDLSYYVMLILTPVISGMAIGIALESFTNVNTPLEFSSLPRTWIAMVVTLAQGLAFSFVASSLWLLGGWIGRFTPIAVIALGTAIGLGILPRQYFLWGLSTQQPDGLIVAIPALGASIFLAWVASRLVRDDFEVKVVSKKEIFLPAWNRLGFLGNGTLRLLVAKEAVDLIRSGSLKKMIVSYSVPLIVLLLMAWLVDFAEAPIPINLLSYAPFLGFFGFNFYSWLTALDSPEHMNGLPLGVPQLIRAKVTVYFLATTWISVIFLCLMAWKLDEWAALPVGLVVMIANSIYIVCLTAFLMGLAPNKAIFDAKVMSWFWLGTVIPLLSLFLLSFTQGDVSFYENWAHQVGDKGLDAEAVKFDNDRMAAGFKGILWVSAGLVGAALLLMKLLDRKWGRAEFNN